MKRKIDYITIGGLALAFLGIGLGYYFEGGDFGALIAISPILIIYGGTFGVVFLSLTKSAVKNVPKTLKIIFTDNDYDFQGLIDNLCELTKVSRRDGIVALGTEAEKIDDIYVKRGIEYILDGSDYDTIKELLEKDIESMITRHQIGQKPYEQAGGFSPTMGIVGTVLGLVVVLGSLGNASISDLGHGIAVAFLATFNGVAAANLVFLPFAEKLKNKSKEELLFKEIAMQGILGIQIGTNPKILKKKLLVFLSESNREEISKNNGKEVE